jgi:hypothetical protein
MQAATGELKLRSAPGSEGTSGFEGGLSGALPRDEPTLPWWERPPFSGSAHSVATSLDSAGPDAADFDSNGAGPETLPSETFLSVLSAVAAPEPALHNRDEQNEPEEPLSAQAAWSAAVLETGEEADSLSYEAALRRGARVSFAGGRGVDSARARAGAANTPSPCGSSAHTPAHAESPESAGRDSSRRQASVTLRLSQAECAQLKQRAAEAGLTVSAYIRSCTFEAEALRAQVKQAIQELRGEFRPELEADFRRGLRDGWRGDLREGWCGEAAEKGPKGPERPAPPAFEEESPRRWWRLRTQEKNHSAQA